MIYLSHKIYNKIYIKNIIIKKKFLSYFGKRKLFTLKTQTTMWAKIWKICFFNFHKKSAIPTQVDKRLTIKYQTIISTMWTISNWLFHNISMTSRTIPYFRIFYLKPFTYDIPRSYKISQRTTKQ